MKKKKIFALMAAALSLAACSTNDIADITHDDADNVVNVASVTRSGEGASTTSTMTAPFHLVNTTQLDYYNTKFEADYEYNATTSSYVTNKGQVLWCNIKDDNDGRTINRFEAFTPLYTPENNASYISFTLPTDQSSADKLEAADWMTAYTTSTKAEAIDGLSLNFEHKYSKLHFSITTAKDDATNLNSNSFSVFGIVTPYYDATAHTVEAIIDPTWKITTTTPIITINTTDNETLSVPIPSEITGFEAGKQYNFNLAIGHNTLSISQVSVTDWTSEPINMESSDAKTDQYDYVTFTAEGEQGFKFEVTALGSEITKEFPGFEYSVNNGEWISIPGTGMPDYVTFGGDKGTIRLRGKSLENIGTSLIIPWGPTQYARVTFKNDVKVACSGDIRTLIDYENYTSVETGNATFYRLFYNCTQLTSAPKLPATKLAVGCYGEMFSDCSSLKEAPMLPATELEDYCYNWMFYNCTSLTEAPVLPATKLAINCYNSMFSGCTSLEKAPELPATTLENACYDTMFSGCTSLTKAPVLPATTLVDDCYAKMFSNCSNLSEIKMLAVSGLSNPQCIVGWLLNAGTSAPSRTLILDSQDFYVDMLNIPYCLPDNWQVGYNGTTVVDINGNAITNNR